MTQTYQRLAVLEAGEAAPVEVPWAGEEAGLPGEAHWLSVLREQLRGLRYGTIQITVHDGRVVQLDRTQRTRLDGPKGGDALSH